MPAPINIIKWFSFLWLSLAVQTHAQPQPQMSYCLSAAQEFETFEFKKNKKFVLDANDLKRALPLGCRSYEFQVTLKGTNGFRVITEINGETWSVDDKFDFVRLSRAGSKVVAYTPSAKKEGAVPGSATTSTGGPTAAGNASSKNQGIFSAAASAGHSNSSSGRVPMAVLAGDHVAPLMETAPLQIPTLTSILNSTVSTVRPEDEAKTKLEKCFSKRLFGTKMCGTLFEDLEKQCAIGTEKEKISVMCLEYTRRVTEVQLDDCEGDEETWGKCELRAAQFKKFCANPLKQSSSECRSLNKYLAKTPTGKPNPAGRGVAQSDGEAPGSGMIAQLTSIGLLKNVQTLEPALRKLLHLRPVSYELKAGRRKDIGFVAEEVEAVDPALVTYSSSSELQAVRYPQLTALLTSGLQELYGMCKSDIDLNKDLIRKVISLQDENVELKKQLSNQAKDLLLIKEKLGLK